MPAQLGVSVVIPTHNRPDSTEMAIRSALAQNWDPLEVLVVDDASCDDTAQRVARLADDDPRVRLICLPENGGASAARNRGIAEAALPFIAFLDSDNTFVEGKLAAQMQALLDERPGAVAFTGYLAQSDSGERIVSLPRWDAAPEEAIARLLVGCCVNTSTFLAPRGLLLEAGGFRTDLVCCEDHDLWLRLAAAGHRFAYHAEPLTRYRLHSGSLSADPVCVAESSELVVGRFLAREDLPAAARSRSRRIRAHWALNSAGAYLETGNGAAALAALARAALLAPAAVRSGWVSMAISATFRRERTGIRR